MAHLQQQEFCDKIALKLYVEQVVEFLPLFREAKEIEKEQIIDAFNLGQQEEAKQEFWTKGNEYYEETFNK
jgi:hypothetical protein